MHNELTLANLCGFWQEVQPRRVIVIGSCGSGKSTLVRQLGQLLDCPAHDIDDEYWLPGWQGRPDSEFRQRLEQIVSESGWALAGNYSRTQDITWPRAEWVIWLDLPLPLVFVRVVKRCLRRALRREMICNGNFESLRMTFMSKESLLIWLVKSYARQRRQYLKRLGASQMPPILHLTSPAQVRQLLEQVWLYQRPAQGRPD